MTDKEVGELWDKYKAFRWDYDGIEMGCDAVKLIRKIVEEVTFLELSSFDQHDDVECSEDWHRVRVLKRFGIDPATW